ncbi:hypothetical protein V1264_019208 [Littorina saxatilis]|uniref:Uncharacterized protein n=1 Tax=Littorina saxatilis TaxID=31220 RepID=A0AAN9BEU6_9CAEN
MDGKKDRGKTAKGTGPTFKVPVVQLGTDLDRHHKDHHRTRQVGSRTSSADYDHHGPRCGWWTVSKSTGSPYLMDQRFPLRFGNSQQGAQTPRSFASKIKQKTESLQSPAASSHFKSKSCQPVIDSSHKKAESHLHHDGSERYKDERPNDVRRKAGISDVSASRSHRSAQIHKSSDGSECQHDIQSRSPGGRFRDDLERQYSIAVQEGKERTREMLDPHSQKNPRERSSEEDTVFLRYYNHDDVSRMRRHSQDHHSATHRHRDDEIIFTRRQDHADHSTTKWQRNETLLRHYADDNGFTRSHSFDVKISARSNGKDYYGVSKRHSDDDLITTRRFSDDNQRATRTHDEGRFTLTHSDDETVDVHQPASSTPFYRAALTLMQTKQKKASSVQNSTRFSARGVDLQLQKLRQQFQEAQQRPPQYRQIQPRPAKHHRYGSAHRPTKQPKSILRQSPASAREGRQLSPSIQRGMSLYIEKLLVLTERSGEPRHHTTHEDVDASRFLSPKPQKRVTFGNDVIFDVQADVGMTGRVLSHLSDC